jgi:SAM-dependent methyltransferase
MLFDTELETDKGQMILQPSQWAQSFFRGDAASKGPELAEQQRAGSPFVDWSAIPNDLAGLSDEEIGSLPGWYYSVELRPGVFTKGEDFPSAGLPRAALSRAELKGWRCLDIGAMEGLITTVLCRRGAGRVIAYDRPTYTRSKLAAVRRAYETTFDFVDGIKLADLRPALREAGEVPFDLVVFSGVMYHMLDPLGGLAHARSLVRDGGLLILETSAIIDHEAIFAANRENRFGGHAYLLPSLPLLEYFARLFRLKILDCEYVVSSKDQITGHVVCRVCLVARAMREPMLDPGDPLLGYAGLIDADLAEFIDWDWLRSDAEPVYYLPHLATQRAEGPQSLDVLMTVVANKPRPVKPRDVTLCLSDYA